MKGIILEIIGNHAVVLTKSGDYKKVRLKNSMNYACGDEIEMNKSIFKLEFPELQWKQYRVQFSILAILFIMMVFPGIYQANQVAGHVNIDINPSVELTYNKQMEVIEANSLNDDGEALLSKKEILKMNVHDAVNSLIVLAMEEGYITSEKDNGIIISITDIKGELYREELSKQIAESTKDVKSIQVEYVDSDVETFEKAQKLKKSPGEVIMEEKLGISHRDAKTNKMTTYELVSLYHEYKNAITEKNGKNDKRIANEVDEKNTNKQEKKSLLDDTKNIREELKDREKEEKLKEKETKDELKEEEKELRDKLKEEEKELRDKLKEEEKELKDRLKKEEKEFRDKGKRNMFKDDN